MFSIVVTMFTMTNPSRNLTTGPRVPRQRFHVQVRRAQNPNALRSNALSLLGHVLRANDQRRPSLRFNDWINDWSPTSLGFNDWSEEEVLVSNKIGS